ncbi:MAG: Maf family protein [Victivallales bacterium]|jgi:septum formation protein|nr:Maf family protein [Victivallales bacterium]
MLILASNSPRRRELLSRLKIDFAVEPTAIEEETALYDLRLLPQHNAELKAAAIAAKHPTDLVLGADTMILFNGKIIGKPRNQADAFAILMELAGRTHEVITGLALLRCNPKFHRVWSETTQVTFKPFKPDTAKRYLDRVYVLDKAGAYAIQEHGDLLVATVNGDMNNVVGLPLEKLRKELKS